MENTFWSAFGASLLAALVTAIGLGANRPQDAVYPTSQVYAEGKAYEGTT